MTFSYDEEHENYSLRGYASHSLHVSLTELNKFLLTDFKRYWPYLCYVNEAKIHSWEGLYRKLGHVIVFSIFFQDAWSPKKNAFFA